MRIAYGVMGYGRGHAMRSLSVLPQLMQEHEVTVFTAGDAYDVLAPLFPTVRIPMIGYRYNERGQHSLPRTVGENAGPLADLLLGGPGIEQVQREFRDRGIQLVISDSEAWCHRAAEKLKLPRISFDHVGIIAWCKPHFPADLWLTGMRDAIGYRALMGQPDRTLISSFYPAEPRHPGTRIVGPMLRDEVLRASAAGARPARTTCWPTSTRASTSTGRRSSARYSCSITRSWSTARRAAAGKAISNTARRATSGSSTIWRSAAP